MNSSNKHIIFIPFSGVGLFDDPDDNEWLVYRISVFINYTLKSIENQTVKPDLLWLSFDGRESNGWIEALRQRISIPIVITHDGLIYTDDKFIWRWRGSQYYQSTFKQALRMLGRAIKHRNIKVIGRYISRLLNKNRSLIKRLDKSLPKVLERLGEFNYVYLTRLDSDDMIHKDWVKDTNKIKPKYNLCLTRNKGLVYNGDKVAEWNPTRHPQFFTLCIPRNVFEKGEWFKDYWNGYISHEDADRVWDTTLMPDGQYLMLMHGNQISSTWNHPYRGKEVEVDLKDFGICQSGK